MRTTASMSEYEQQGYINETNTTFFKSDFNFLREHNGWRPKKIHLIEAPTHSGKSTMIRSLIWDFVINTSFETALIWLSEESTEDFKQEFAKLRLPDTLTRRIIIASEQDQEMSLSQRKLLFADTVKRTVPSILFFDNITTSEFYMDRGPDDQAKFAKYLKKIAHDEEIPIVVIAHTGGETGLSNRLIELNDIRGGKSIVNLAEFAYILQRFKVYDDINKRDMYFPTIRIEKHRGYVCDNMLFKLKFNRETVTFTQDRSIPWNEFKEAFKNQQNLK